MKISDAKLRELIQEQLSRKELTSLYETYLGEADPPVETDEEGGGEEGGGSGEGEEELGAADRKTYKPKFGGTGAKLPTNKTEAGTYVMKALKGAQGVIGQEIPTFIQLFDDMLEQFMSTHMSQSKTKKIGKGIEIGKQRAGIKDV